jgi:Na+-translocating ferredoxin:NAD+ oxidoreductase RnfD subunit
VNSPRNITRHGRAAAIASSSVLLVTIAHHSYGRNRFATPWRHHISLIALPMALVLWLAYFIFTRRYDSPAERTARGVFIVIALLGLITWIGFFEGGYNHALKIALFHSGIAAAALRRYFLPNIRGAERLVF